MRVQRLRPQWSAEQLDSIYPSPHDHRIYGHGHHLRVQVTIELARWAARNATSVADLSCGNAAIPKALNLKRTVLGDYAPGYRLSGPIEDTVEQIDPVDIFVLSETLEHLHEPSAVLSQIRSKTDTLVLTTPIEAWDDTNGEHYWAWDREGVESLLESAEFKPDIFASLDSRPFGETYNYGIWVAS